MITKKFDHTKYEIILKITAKGVIEKVDIIGSLYGQLRDVLKTSVSFEDLVKEGKIGIVQCELKKLKTKTTANCTIPTNLDKKTVCLLAAKCEQITKIGHVQGEMEVIEIRHSQKDIETKIHDRAKELENKFFNNKIEKINKNNSVKKIEKAKIVEIVENVYSTLQMKRYKKIYLVEGRSDVKTLVHFGFVNVISINGSFMDIIKLKNEKWFKNKEIITFFDGDSSAKKLLEQVKKEFSISKSFFAPKGKEVTQLNGNQIQKILGVIPKINPQEKNVEETKNQTIKINENEDNENYFSKDEFLIVENYIEAIKKSGRMVGFDKSFAILFDEPISKLKQTSFEQIYTLIYDGMCENTLIKQLKNSKIKCVIAKSFSEKPEKIATITFEEFEQSIEK